MGKECWSKLRGRCGLGGSNSSTVSFLVVAYCSAFQKKRMRIRVIDKLIELSTDQESLESECCSSGDRDAVSESDASRPVWSAHCVMQVENGGLLLCCAWSRTWIEKSPGTPE